MKKMIVIGMMSCAALNGMEITGAGHGPGIFRKNTPPDINKYLNFCMNTYDNLIDAVNAIKEISCRFSALHKMINEKGQNQKGFTELVHILSNKFETTPDLVAEKFNTPVSQDYLRLIQQLTMAIIDGSKEEVVQLIDGGADINFISRTWETPLGWAVRNSTVIKILLDKGARVRERDIDILFYNIKRYELSKEGLREPEKSFILLQEALQKQREKQEDLQGKIREIID